MFTGIIQAVGVLQQSASQGGDRRLRLQTGRLDLADVRLGDSIAVNGVCLTVIALPGDGFEADVSRETLAHTTLETWSPGRRVNLEKALAVGERLGGHLVSGHVDGVGEILSLQRDARSTRYRVKAPDALARYLAHKGSVCVDGVSLTVNAVDGAEFELNIVPHTLSETVFADYRPGSRVNLEVDVLARYLERLLLGDSAAEPATTGGITRGLLAEHGFLKGEAV